MLGHRLRRWPNINSTLDQSVVLAGIPQRSRIRESDQPVLQIRWLARTTPKYLCINRGEQRFFSI